MGIGKTKVFCETKCPLCFTLETNYCKGTKEKGRYTGTKTTALRNSVRAYRLQVLDYEEVGVSLIDTLLEYIEKHPDSRLGTTYFHSSKTLYDTVFQEMKSQGNLKDPNEMNKTN